MEKPATDIYSFEDLRRKGYTYVDKTGIILPLVDDSIGKQFFLARPRRFGKSLLLSTLQALFEGRRDLFTGLAIEPKWDWSKTWPVLHLDMGSCQADTVEETREKIGTLLSREAVRLGVTPRGSEISAQLQFLIDDLAARNREAIVAAAKARGEEAPLDQGQMVLLVDEYDKPLLKHLGSPDVNVYRDLLKQFYSVIKTLEGKQRFAFITGVSKFAKVSIFSDLNNLKDRTMSPKEATLLGYTHEEVRRTYPQLITALGEKYGMDFEGAFEMIVGKYDGYRFHQDAEPVVNPVSLGCCLEAQEFGDYWSETAVPSFLIDILKEHPLNFATVDLEQRALGAYEPAKPTVETLLFQTGYLTIKSARMIRRNPRDIGRVVYSLGFPNDEVEQSFLDMLVPAYVGQEEIPCNNAQRTAGEAILANDVPLFFKALRSFFRSIPYDLTDRQNEQMWQTIVWTVLKGVGIYCGGEIKTADGRIDMVIETETRVFILEFKLDDTAANALRQIKEKGYAEPYATSPKGVTLLGVGFSSEKRTITDTLDEVLR